MTGMIFLSKAILGVIIYGVNQNEPLYYLQWCVR